MCVCEWECECECRCECVSVGWYGMVYLTPAFAADQAVQDLDQSIGFLSHGVHVFGVLVDELQIFPLVSGK